MSVVFSYFENKNVLLCHWTKLSHSLLMDLSRKPLLTNRVGLIKNTLWVWMMKPYFKPQLQSAKCRERLILSCYQQLLSVNLPICVGINPWTISVNLNWVSLTKCNNYQCTVTITREKQQMFINFNWNFFFFLHLIDYWYHIFSLYI